MAKRQLADLEYQRVAVVYRVVCQLCRGAGRRARQGASRRIARHAQECGGQKKLASPSRSAKVQVLDSASLRKDDLVLVEAGDIVPADGEVLDGVAR